MMPVDQGSDNLRPFMDDNESRDQPESYY